MVSVFSGPEIYGSFPSTTYDLSSEISVFPGDVPLVRYASPSLFSVIFFKLAALDIATDV